jgi:hypothetical protein
MTGWLAMAGPGKAPELNGEAQKNSKLAVSDMGMLGFMSRFWVS